MVESSLAGMQHLRDLAPGLAFDLQSSVQQFAFYAAQQRRDDAEIESLPPDKPYDPNADPSSSRYLPIPGAPAAPNAPPPQGVLPDPYNHPQ